MCKYKLLFLLLMNISSSNLGAERWHKEEEYFEHDKNYDKFIFVTLSQNATLKPGPTSNLMEYRRIPIHKGTKTTKKGNHYTNATKAHLRIIGGTPAALGDVPWQVAIKYGGRFSRKYGTFCGGSIIAHSKVLTAGHCVERWMSKSPLCNKGTIDGTKMRRIWVVAGTLETVTTLGGGGESSQWKKIRRAYYPPRYKFPDNDISVLLLTTPFVYNSHVHSVLMQSTFVDMKRKCLASGFGGINNAFSQKLIQSKVLLLAELNLLSDYECSILHSRRYSRKFVCTSVEPTDTSSGDSGGPLVCMEPNRPKTEAVLVGVVSGASRKVIGGQTIEVSYFTRVSAFQKFIARSKANIEKLKFVLLLTNSLLSVLVGNDLGVHI